MGRVLQRLVMLLAFGYALLVPAIVRAALLPACEHDPSTRVPVDWDAGSPELGALDVRGAPDSCDLPLGWSVKLAREPRPDDLGDMRVPAMCDARGASAIAPPRIHTIGDARIEAVGGTGTELGAPVIGPGPKHSPFVGAAPALADHAVLDGTVQVPPPSSEPAAPFPPVTGGPRCGVARGIDHPPR